MRDLFFKLKLNRIKRRGERYKKIKEANDAYAQYYPNKNKKKVSNVMLVTIVIAIVGYFIANFILQYRMGVEISSTLTTCWFSFWGCEIVAITTIKVTKVKNEYDRSIDSESFDDDATI